ncbi:MAG: hypothetical protein HRU09_17220, partial [Oligoflexales bacterium]|nr:hypothetical protein [Oligoflexales bacterium]
KIQPKRAKANIWGIGDYISLQRLIKEASVSKKPTVINGIIEGGEHVLAEPFRRDALQQPKRYLDKYSHLVNKV